MKCDIKYKKGRLSFSFTLEEGDGGNESQKAKMGRRQCEFHLPKDWKLDSVHPDIMALVVLLMVYPFTHQRLELPMGVSTAFAEHVARLSKKEIYPVDNTLKPRRSSPSQLPGLAFSGGVDSTAALLLMPENTVLGFMDRIIRTKSLYKPEAAHHACHTLRRQGRSVYMIPTDLEYLRNPVGFPVDMAVAAPLLLLADYIGLNGIGFGTIMESAYLIGHTRYGNYVERGHYKLWGKLFELTGLPFIMVTAGLSEVATASLVLKSKYRDIAQSCIRGKVGEPCLNCNKCFRKDLMEKVLEAKNLDDGYLDALFKIREARTQLLKLPIHHENVLAYITARYHGNHPLMNLLRKRVRGDKLDLPWLEKWYSPSEVLIPEIYRESIVGKIRHNFQPMNENEEKSASDWDLTDVIASADTRRYQRELAEAFTS